MNTKIEREPAHQLAIREEDVWGEREHMSANRDGWDLFDCDGSPNGRLQLCRIDDPQLWSADRLVEIETEQESDEAVWELVWGTPSDLHAKVLRIIRAENPMEYDAIERWCWTAIVHEHIEALREQRDAGNDWGEAEAMMLADLVGRNAER